LNSSVRILGIETSCDETGIAVYDSLDGLLAQQLYSQTDMHARYGGVVPELSSRDQIRKTLPMIDATLAETKLSISDITAIAYTKGPGLAGALHVGAMVGCGLAYALGVPAIGVHHLEAHLMAVMLEELQPPMPFLGLLVSGGHTSLIRVDKLGSYHLLGETLDDAAGEAFDKTARLLGLPYPGGRLLSELAESGDINRFDLPRPMLNRPGLDFSFSGLKTAVALLVDRVTLDDQTRSDIAAAVEAAIVDVLVRKTQRAIKQTELRQVVVAGGVAANQVLRQQMQAMVSEEGGQLYVPRPAYCTDNGAMVAYLGCQRLLAGDKSSLDASILPRWPL